MKPLLLRLWCWLRENRPWLVNLYLFLHICAFVAWQVYQLVVSGRFDFVETSFVVQNIVLAAVVLIRRDHLAVDGNWVHQAVALAAFFSGVAFIGQPTSGGDDVRLVSQIVVATSNLIGIASLLHLGKSFGILIANRGIQRGGVYRLIRHPMYLSDILLRIGFAISHYSLLSLGLAFVSIAFYVYRAVLEERFLVHDSEYRDYRERVRYCFVPGVF